VDGTFRPADKNEMWDDNASDIVRSYRSRKEVLSNKIEADEMVFVIGNVSHDLNYITRWTGAMIKSHIETLSRDLKWAERSSKNNPSAKTRVFWLNARIMLINEFLNDDFTEVVSDRRGTYDQHED
jgi:hypothetical protein